MRAWLSGQPLYSAVAGRRTFVLLCVASVLVAGCATRHEQEAPLGTHHLVVRAISYDEKGLPFLRAPLAERPSKAGDRFTLVRLAQGRPEISYDIIIGRQKPDFEKPLQVVYEWTGKGFTQGVNVTRFMAQGLQGGSSGVQGGREAIILLVIIVTPIAAGTAGGFVVGVADGTRHTVLEVSKAIVPGEQVVTCTTYEYDGSNRLVFMRMMSPDRTQEWVRTEFEYEGSGTVPSKTTVKTPTDGRWWQVE